MAYSSSLLLALLFLFAACGEEGGHAPTNGAGFKKIFTTAWISSDGNLGGIAGADGQCMTDANYPGSGTYKALLSDGASRTACSTANCSGGSNENIDWVLSPGVIYLRQSDLAVIGMANASGIFAFPLTHSFDEVSNIVWTGLLGDWQNGGDCQNWSSGNPGDNAHRGGTDATDSTAVESTFDSCDNVSPLLCVEQ